MIVLDTNVISEIMRPTPDAGVVAWLRQQPLAELAVSAVTVAEIGYGIRRLPTGRRRRELESRFRTFLARGFGDRILAFDAESAEIYADIVVTREAAGRPIDAFDAMIAAVARSRAASVATRDVDDFSGCGLTVIDPWARDS